jgi:acylphosphatase
VPAAWGDKKKATSGSMSSSAQNRSRQRIIYHGGVQGVGFRATTASLAHNYPVVGYVRNVPDGTVEVLVEGSADAVRQFLAEVADAFRNNISRADVVEDHSTDQYSRFTIRY